MSVQVFRAARCTETQRRRWAGCNLDEPPVHHQADTQRPTTTHGHIHTHGQFKMIYHPNHRYMSSDGGRKPEIPEGTHTNTRRTCKPQRQRLGPGTEPRTTFWTIYYYTLCCLIRHHVCVLWPQGFTQWMLVNPTVGKHLVYIKGKMPINVFNREGKLNALRSLWAYY